MDLSAATSSRVAMGSIMTVVSVNFQLQVSGEKASSQSILLFHSTRFGCRKRLARVDVHCKIR